MSTFCLKLTGILLIALLCPAGLLQGRTAMVQKSELEIPRDVRTYEILRVAVKKNVSEVTVQTDSNYVLYDAKGKALDSGDHFKSSRVTANESGIQIGSRIFKTPFLTIECKNGHINLGKQVYRHALTVWSGSKNKISIANEIPIEDYLKGVLPFEASPKWPMEALKAQAVSCRTFALYKALQHRDDPYDLESDVISQVYIGKSIEHDLTNAAIDATRGMIMTYRGKIFPGFFHSTCGGATARVDDVWNLEPHPALRGVSCDFCRGTKHYRWTSKFSQNELKAIFRKQGYNFPEIQEITADEKDKSGRARFFTIHYHQDKKIRFDSDNFRSWLGAGSFKSTLIDSIEKQGDFFMFRGRGWGHGVGMCQYGMAKLGELGYTYRKILDYYYPDAEIVTIFN